MLSLIRVAAHGVEPKPCIKRVILIQLIFNLNNPIET